MLLTISSPEQQIWSGPVTKVTIPTQSGEVTILPGHQSLISVIDAGLVKLTPEKMPNAEDGYIVDHGQIVISLAKGLLAVHDNEIVITTAIAARNPQESAEVLEQMRADMLEKIAKIKEEGNEDALEEALIHMEKITADLRIAKIGHVR